jgi:AcrR family transcriptional regulator
MKKAPSKRWERRSEARPAELVTAALELFAERGFAGTRLEEVAARAGVSKATVYLYFDSKEKLFEAVVRQAVTPKLDRAEALVDAFEGTTPELVRRLLALFETLLDSGVPAVVKLIVAEAGNFPALARLYAELVVQRGMGLLQRIVRRGVDRGEFRPVEPANVAPLVLAPVLLLALWRQSMAPHTEFRLDARAVLAEHAETLLRGLAADSTNRDGEAKP